ncbi:MAG: DsbA family protein, partial [Planktomarina sp.]
APGRATEATVMKAARDLGLDTDQLKADMTSIAVEAHLAESTQMARSLGFTGTPAFIVGDTAVPGVLSASELAGLVAEVRAEN